MSTLLIHIWKHLEESPLLISDPLVPHGPLFSRWLPNGEEDAVVSHPAKNTEIKLWFERRGYTGDGGLIRYDPSRQEVDLAVMERQSVLMAGPLTGRLTLKNMDEANLEPIIQDQKGNEKYMTIGRKVVGLLQEEIGRLLSILRNCYGQYWITQLERWDHQDENLGAYCSYLGLYWSIDSKDLKDWKFFRPNAAIARIEAKRSKDAEYIQQEDWQEIKRLCEQKFQPSDAAKLLCQTHRLMDEGELRHAIIEGVTAAEAAISQYMKERTASAPDEVKASLQSFYNLPNPAKLVATVGALPGVDLADLALALKAIKTRNDIIHEAAQPPAGAEQQLEALMKLVALLISGPRLRFPIVPNSNALAPPDKKT